MEPKYCGVEGNEKLAVASIVEKEIFSMNTVP
jgi:hypothetical protein